MDSFYIRIREEFAFEVESEYIFSFPAKVCMRSYVNGEWITTGDCGVGIPSSLTVPLNVSLCLPLMKGSDRMSEIMNELQLRAEDEKKWIADKRDGARY